MVQARVHLHVGFLLRRAHCCLQTFDGAQVLLTTGDVGPCVHLVATGLVPPNLDRLLLRGPPARVVKWQSRGTEDGRHSFLQGELPSLLTESIYGSVLDS